MSPEVDPKTVTRLIFHYINFFLSNIRKNPSILYTQIEIKMFQLKEIEEAPTGADF